MVDTQKIKKDNLIAAAVVFALMTGYAFLAGLSLLIPLLVTVSGIHLIWFKRADGRKLLQLSLLLALIAATAHSMTLLSHFNPDYVPVAAISMLVILLFNDLQMAFAMAFISAAVVALIVGAGMDYMLSVFVGGLAGAYVVKDARTRGRLIIAGVVVGLVQAGAFFLAHPVITKALVIDQMRPLFMSGLISAAVILATLKVFEALFGELTNFSLLELSDSLNQPLLRRMAFEAPGTYHHSLLLSNLSSAAADAIGANALLARVGSYYHDIGKLEKPQYFTENQMMIDNKHDHLEPSMSRLVILNHVTEGVELARRHKISQKIIDFIEQHHGTSLIYYFYQRALEGTEAGAVSEENFRYPGPKPQTKEVALVMLADSVEGATRSLEEHTQPKIEEVVRKIINNKFIDGQLDECGLTLRDLELIGTSFTKTLSAMYHVRVKYPNPKKNGH